MEGMDSTRTMKDLYQILGVSSAANDQQIKASWRAKARSAHPDQGGNEEEFHQIREAYETLSNPVERARYDASRAEQKSAQENAQRRTAETFRQREAAWSREKARRDATRRVQPRAARGPSLTFEQRTRARQQVWWRRTPRFVRTHVRGGVIVLVVSWAAWMFSRVGVLHVHNLAEVVGVKTAPSLSDTALVVSVASAFGLAWVVDLVTRHLSRSKDFATWVLAGVLGVYVEPLSWITAVQSGVLIVSASVLAWMLFAKAAPQKSTAIAAWRPVKRRGATKHKN
jgi:DnaJ-domain-containing protein 1